MPYISVNNIELYYEIYGEGEPLLLLHGAQGDSSSFSRLVKPLSNKFTVISFDQRGAGKSEKPDMVYTMELIAEDAAQLIKALEYDSVHLFGVSLGGMIAQTLCAKWPKLIKTLVLGCTLPGGWEKAVKKDVPPEAGNAFSNDDTVSDVDRAKALAEVAYAPGYIERHPEIIKHLIQLRKENPVNKIGFSRRLEMTGLYDGFDDLKKIACPCLVVTGKQDQLLDYKNSYVIADEIPQAALCILANSGHVFWDEELELFLAIYFKFLEKCWG